MRTVDRKLQEINAHTIISNMLNGKDGDIDYSKLADVSVTINSFNNDSFKKNIEDVDLAYFGPHILPLIFNKEKNSVLIINDLQQVIRENGKEDIKYDEHEKQFPVIKPEFRKSETASVVKLKTGEYVTIRYDGEILKKKVDNE